MEHVPTSDTQLDRLQQSLQPTLINILNQIPQNQDQGTSSNVNLPGLQEQNIVGIILSQTISGLFSKNQSINNNKTTVLSPQANALEEISTAVNSVISQITDPLKAQRKRKELKDAIEKFFDPDLETETNLSIRKPPKVAKKTPYKPLDEMEPEIIDLENDGEKSKDDNSDEELSRYQFDSQYSTFKDIKLEISHPDFSKSSLGLRCMVPISMVSHEDFKKLKTWEIPGLPYDFGDGMLETV